jgi:hypothetical protein
MGVTEGSPMPDDQTEEGRIIGEDAARRPGAGQPQLPEPAPVGRETDYSELPQYPDSRPELPPRGKADVLAEGAAAFAGTLIGAGALGLLSLACAVIVSVRLLFQGSEPLELLRAVAVVTLGGVVAGAAFGGWIDLRRALSHYTRGD